MAFGRKNKESSRDEGQPAVPHHSASIWHPGIKDAASAFNSFQLILSHLPSCKQSWCNCKIPNWVWLKNPAVINTNDWNLFYFNLQVISCQISLLLASLAWAHHGGVPTSQLFPSDSCTGPRSGFTWPKVEDWVPSFGPPPLIPPSSPYLVVSLSHGSFNHLPEAPCWPRPLCSRIKINPEREPWRLKVASPASFYLLSESCKFQTNLGFEGVYTDTPSLDDSITSSLEELGFCSRC